MKSKKSKPKLRKSALCLLVRVNEPKVASSGKVKDNIRHFFTQRKNLRYLVEFSRAFGAELLEVKAKNVTILPMPHLIKAFCDATYNDDADYEVITNNTPHKQARSQKKNQPPANRKEVVCTKIRNRLLTGKALGTKELYSRLGMHKLNESTIRNYYTQVRNELDREGHEVYMIRPGYYKLI